MNDCMKTKIAFPYTNILKTNKEFKLECYRSTSLTLIYYILLNKKNYLEAVTQFL